MLLIILIILAIFIFVIAITAVDGEESAILSIISLLILISPIVVYCNHASDLAIIRQGNLLIETRQEAISEINNQLKNINITQTALMNADSPISSLVRTKSEFVNELANEKIKIAQAKIDIEARSIGPMSGIVWIMGKE